MKNSRLLNTILFVLFIVLGLLAYNEFLQENILFYVDTQKIWNSKRFIAFVLFCAISLALLTLVVRLKQKNSTFINRLNNIRHQPKWLKHIEAILLILMPAILVWFAPLPNTISMGFWINLFLIYSAAISSEWITGDDKDNLNIRIIRITTYLLGAGAAYSVCSKLVNVTNYPFPLYWSEGNRFFDYSTLFGSYRYFVPSGEDIYSFISWGMQLPWAIPFILPNISIGAFRFWYQLMWILPGFLLGITAYKSFSKKKEWELSTIVFGLWAFLFIDQGPVYAPVIIAGIITLLASRTRLVPAILIVILASYYAAVSRWTWSFGPGLWAGLIALLMIENPSFRREKLNEFIRPVLLGLAGLFGGRILPETIYSLFTWIAKTFFGIETIHSIQGSYTPNIVVIPDIIASATIQPLLWERLLPNSTYSPGILLGITWVALPAIGLLFIIAVKKVWKPNYLQIFAIFMVFAAFLGVGLTASVKIGGGSNLHNLDMLLIILAITTIFILAKFWPNIFDVSNKKFLVSALISFLLVIPITYTLRTTSKPSLPDSEAIDESLTRIQMEISNLTSDDEVLFIDHRQLLTFNLVPKIPFVDDYEKKKLMDMSMRGDEDYFADFYEDISNQRFSLIVNEPLNIIIRGEDYAFGNENDTYVEWINIPLDCNYEAIFTSYETGVELLIPRSEKLESYSPCADYIQ